MKKIILYLFFIIATVELLLMLLLKQMELGMFFSWLPMLLDSLIISFSTILAVSYFIKKGFFSIHPEDYGDWIQIQTGVIVFFIEILIMLVLEFHPWVIQSWQEILLDCLLLACLSSLAVYFIALKPVVEWQQKEDVTAGKFDSSLITIIFSYLSIIAILLMFLILNYQQQYNSLKKDLISQEKFSQNQIKAVFLERLSLVKDDVLSISHQVNVVEYLVDHSLQRKQLLDQDFQSLAIFKSSYDELRLLDTNGKELIRIEQNSRGFPVAVSDDQLQDKSDRYYIKESLLLNADQVYLSRIDLNKKNGEIEKPYKPVLRVVSTVRSGGLITGLVVVNLKVHTLLDTLSNLSAKDHVNRQLLDYDGFWLFGNSSEKQWGFMFSDKQQYTLMKEQPEIWSAMQQQAQGVFESEENQIVFHSISLGEPLADESMSLYMSRNPQWYLVSVIPAQILHDRLDSTRNIMTYIFIFVCVFLGLGAYFFIQAIQQKKLAERKIIQMVYSDFLTGLKNRKYLHWKLLREIYKAKKEQSKLAIMYMEIDKFKMINDEMGHEAGDLVLKKVANVLQFSLRDDDTLARIGGDEFAAILPDFKSDEDLQEICKRIVSLIHDGLDIGGMNFYLGVNIGIATLNNYDEPVRSFIARADQAMYDSKASEDIDFTFADKYRTA